MHLWHFETFATGMATKCGQSDCFVVFNERFIRRRSDEHFLVHVVHAEIDLVYLMQPPS